MYKTLFRPAWFDDNCHDGEPWFRDGWQEDYESEYSTLDGKLLTKGAPPSKISDGLRRELENILDNCDAKSGK